MKKIIVAEKKSVGDAYANALNVIDNGNKGYYENNDWIVTWTVGHLVTLSLPEKYSEELKNWKLDTLPFLPEEMKYEVIPDVKKQFQIIRDLYHRSDIECIYYAGDAGREGLYIQMLVRQLAGTNRNAKELVVWIDSQTNEEILRGISQAKSIKEYDNLKLSGFMRAIEDYLTGINFSRLLSVKYSAIVNTGSGQKYKKPISVGRVMTCVLGMIVRKEREIRGFKPRHFYRVIGTIEENGMQMDVEWRCTETSSVFNTPYVYENFGFNKIEDAKKLIGELQNKKITVHSITNKIEKKNPPLLYNLAELQSDCAKKLHISPSQTLKIAQSLYEKKMTTYPRTDARVLSTAIYKEIEKNLNGIEKIYEDYCNKIKNNHWDITKKCVDDSKVTDHYAIIPTGSISSELSQMEKSVYDMICKRFIAAFFPPAEYINWRVEASSGSESFLGTFKTLKHEGFYYVLERRDDGTNKIGDMGSWRQGQSYEVAYSIKEGEVAAPKRYSSGSIILAMENAGNLIEDEELREQIKVNGIGTSATRAEIIDKLLRLNYIEINEKTQVITPSNFGEMIYEVVNATIPSMLSPEITAEWERDLDAIAEGKMDYDEYKKKLYDYIRGECEKVMQMQNNDEMKNRIRPYATSAIRDEIKEFDPYNTKILCPLCGGEIETTSWGFKCKNNVSKNEGCTFSMGDIAGHRLLTNELYYLLNKGKCGPFYDFVSSKNKPFAAYLTWDPVQKKIEFELTEMPWSKTDLFCPICNSPILERDGYYKCAKKECDFRIGKIAGKKISIKQVELLLSKGKTDLISGFKNKAGTSFQAILKWDPAEKKISFVFPDNEDVVTNIHCPICGQKIVKNMYGYRCSNYKKEAERGTNDCSFIVRDVYGHTLKLDELELICAGKRTGLIKLKNKEKKSYEGYLYWDKENNRFGVGFEQSERKEMDCRCPICHEKILKLSKGYACSNYFSANDKCGFYIGVINGVLIEEKQVEKLIRDGQTDLITGFKSKSKSTYSAILKWNSSEKRIEFDFPKQNDTVTKYTCPSCRSARLKESRYRYFCECGLSINKVIAEKELEQDDLVKLITLGRTGVIKGFYSPRTRKKFDAALKITGKNIEFDF